MKRLLLIALPFAFAAPALAAPPVAGQVVESFEMAPDRTVIFEPQPDGKIRIVKVTDKDRHAPMPRNPGQVAVAMTVGLEIGAVIEFNSGLDWAFGYAAKLTDIGTAIPSCPVKGNAVSADQWPDGYKAITIGVLKRIDGPVSCAAQAG